jgi:predicted outer membrane repeat protein
LRNCIRQANKTPEQDRILFSLPAGQQQEGKWVIDLLTPLQSITTPMRIVGPGSGKLTIRPGDGSGIGEIFDFRYPDSKVIDPVPGFELYLAGMTLDCSPTGANGLFLWHQHATIQDCVLTGAHGAVINAGGGLTANSCRFDGNTAAQGGAIRTLAVGDLEITNCNFTNNTGFASGAGSLTQGGAIYNMGTLNVTNCRFSGNKSPSGGAIYSEPTADSSTPQTSTVTLDSCLFDSNSGNIPSQPPGDGGAVFVRGTDLSIQRSTFTNNTGSRGGAIYTENGVRLGRSVLYKNSAIYGGALFLGEGEGSLVNCTLSENTAAGAGGIVLSKTGIDYPTCTLVNCTLFHNGESHYGELFVSGTCELLNTILRPLDGAPSITDGTNGTITSLGHNLAADGGGGFLTASGDLINTKPMLDTNGLQDNGGPTLTLALLPGSPAIGHGDDAVLGGSYNLTTDQRGAGYPRKSGNHVDIGAFELQKASAALAVKPSSNGF